MSLLREIGVAILVILAAVWMALNPFGPYWEPLLPKRFSLRMLIVVMTVLAVLIGSIVALDDVIVRALR